MNGDFVPTPDEGESVGFIVLTLTHGRWCDDWDGVVHATYEQGQQALREASESCYCVLVECHRVPSNGAPFGDLPPIQSGSTEEASDGR